MRKDNLVPHIFQLFTFSLQIMLFRKGNAVSKSTPSAHMLISSIHSCQNMKFYKNGAEESQNVLGKP
jgi:hypothetical protein